MSHGHAGHRGRMKSRVENYGIESLEDHEFLELLLYYGIPRKNTNPIAHDLIDRFGSLKDVFEAPYQELRDAGLPRRAAFLISHMNDFCEMYKAYYVKDNIDEKIVNDHIRDLIKEKCLNVSPNKTFVINLSFRGQVIHYAWVADDPNDPIASVRDVCTIAIRNGAYFVVLAHTNDADSDIPGVRQCMLTADYYDALNQLGIVLLDRYHVTGSDCLSYRELNAFFTSIQDFSESIYYRVLRSRGKE